MKDKVNKKFNENLVGSSLRKRLLVRHRCRSEDIVKSGVNFDSI